MIHLSSGIVGILLLLLIAFEDFRDKAVHGFLFLLSFVVFLLNTLSQIPFSDSVRFFCMNIFFALFIFAFTFFYFLLRKKMQFKQLREVIGAGDLLFIFTLSVAFAPVSFILFLICSNLLTLLLHLLIRQKKFLSAQIPWAGWMSVFLILITIINLSGLYSGLNDYLWIKWLMN